MKKIRTVLRSLFFPKIGKAYWIRVAVVAVCAFIFFRFFCMPMVLDGESMDPNYHSGTLNFCWTPAYWFRKPKRGDVVVLKYSGDHVMLLKRIVALSGDTVEFRDGVLYVNGGPVNEPYVRNKRKPWNLKLRKVEPDCIYVIGDNRSMPMWQHKFGQIHANRIRGTLLL